MKTSSEITSHLSQNLSYFNKTYPFSVLIFAGRKWWGQTGIEKFMTAMGQLGMFFLPGEVKVIWKWKKKVKLFTTFGDLLLQFNDFLLPTRELKVILKFQEIHVDKINFASSLYSLHSNAKRLNVSIKTIEIVLLPDERNLYASQKFFDKWNPHFNHVWTR